MTDSQILQAILDGQVSIREGLKKLETRVDLVEERLGSRLDKLGLQIADLEDDAPSIEQLQRLEKRVKKLEAQLITA